MYLGLEKPVKHVESQTTLTLKPPGTKTPTFLPVKVGVLERGGVSNRNCPCRRRKESVGWVWG